MRCGALPRRSSRRAGRSLLSTLSRARDWLPAASATRDAPSGGERAREGRGGSALQLPPPTSARPRSRPTALGSLLAGARGAPSPPPRSPAAARAGQAPRRESPGAGGSPRAVLRAIRSGSGAVGGRPAAPSPRKTPVSPARSPAPPGRCREGERARRGRRALSSPDDRTGRHRARKERAQRRGRVGDAGHPRGRKRPRREEDSPDEIRVERAVVAAPDVAVVLEDRAGRHAERSLPGDAIARAVRDDQVRNEPGVVALVDVFSLEDPRYRTLP